jgi:hypothetical protein
MSVDADCLSNYRKTKDGWKCLMSQYALQFVKVPMFIVQSFIDGYQISHALHVKCLVEQTPCSKNEIKYINSLRKSMLQSVRQVLPDHSGYWITSCEAHTIAHHDTSWNTILVQSKSLKSTFLDWYSRVTEFLRSGKQFKDQGLKVFGGEYDPGNLHKCRQNRANREVT